MTVTVRRSWADMCRDYAFGAALPFWIVAFALTLPSITPLAGTMPVLVDDLARFSVVPAFVATVATAMAYIDPVAFYRLMDGEYEPDDFPEVEP